MADTQLVRVPVEYPFCLDTTLKSGQLFHWEAIEWYGLSGYAGCIGSNAPTFIASDGAGGVFISNGHAERAIRYFGLDQDMETIHSTFPTNDLVLKDAIAFCPGIRLARQPLWECLATFITSSLKQVAHIRGISMTLRQRYGTPYTLDGKSFYSYPEPESFVEAGEDELRKCALGYRAKSLFLAARAVSEGEIDLEKIENEMDLSEARVELMKLHGVGDKIANCALLFGSGRWGAFPIDVWIERILRDLYRKRVKGPKLQLWAERYFGENAGYAQQYLFHFARKTL